MFSIAAFRLLLPHSLGKGREGRGMEEKGRERKGKEGKRREGKVRGEEGKGKDFEAYIIQLHSTLYLSNATIF